ncbi:NAD(P)/FAD-dependent oxidoreductase [Methanolobus halotolerans]|uniref:NAD(P)/FAD-dependent oxidoreductase n=1 Tax=Methanolobus halotolerans TaxID=2052935 RepID=A0A4E0QBD9_9EURY|nr:NAD(P)/FAD-dependent oxidoreductase [Methanolobus halotolerans]TGC09844.1 NAD(P)/FAD-dependent oxidoreductase [Methanolobus halotolerans]
MDADIIVIGASPAGVMAARNASAKGCKVILLDKKEAAGVPTHPANTFFKGMFDRTGEKVDPSYVVKNLRGAYIIAPSGRNVAFEGDAYFLDRRKFDEFYIRQAEEAGAEVRFGIEVLNVLRSEKSFLVSTSKGKMKCKLVIVSDGINSRISALLGMKPIKHPEDIAWSLEAEIEAEGIGEPDMFEYYVGNHAPGWKSTYSPCGGNRATLGMYVRRHGKDVSDFFDDWLEKFKTLKGIDEVKIINTSVGGDPIAALPGEIVADGVMITGGSAAQSGIGYGMHAGQMCGDIAAEAIAKGDTSKRYLSEYRQLWNRTYRTEYYLGRLALETLRKMNNKEIDEMIKVFEGEDLKILGGSPFSQALQISKMILKNNPSSILSYRAVFRTK